MYIYIYVYFAHIYPYLDNMHNYMYIYIFIHKDRFNLEDENISMKLGHEKNRVFLFLRKVAAFILPKMQGLHIPGNSSRQHWKTNIMSNEKNLSIGVYN